MLASTQVFTVPDDQIVLDDSAPVPDVPLSPSQGFLRFWVDRTTHAHSQQQREGEEKEGKKMIREILSSNLIVSRLQALRGAKEPVLVLFFATKKEDGTRWCPDCEAAEPIIEEASKNAPAGVYLLSVNLTRDEWKENPGKDHPLRKAPFNVPGIPTMLLWDTKNGKTIKTFGEEDLLQLESLSSFFASLGQRPKH